MGWIPIKKRLNLYFQACYLGFECNPLLVQAFKARVALKKQLRQTRYELVLIVNYFLTWMTIIF